MENYEPDPSDAVSAVAEASGREAAEVAYDMMCHSKDGSSALGCLWRPVFANRPDGTCKRNDITESRIWFSSGSQ